MNIPILVGATFAVPDDNCSAVGWISPVDIHALREIRNVNRPEGSSYSCPLLVGSAMAGVHYQVGSWRGASRKHVQADSVVFEFVG